MKVDSNNKNAKQNWTKPKILLIDLDQDEVNSLRDFGFSISVGSFGHPYSSDEKANWTPVRFNGHLPENYAESDIVIVDLASQSTVEVPNSPVIRNSDGDVTYVKTNFQNSATSRPYFMALNQSSFDRILKHGGIVIIFGGPFSIETYSNIKYSHDNFNFTNWGFVDLFQSIYSPLENRKGREIVFNSDFDLLKSLVSRYVNDMYYDVILNHVEIDKQWHVFATNKHGDPVGAVYVVNDENAGLVYIVPNLASKAAFLIDLLTEYLPSVSPNLFPYFENAHWKYQAQYELSTVNKIKDTIDTLETDTRMQVQALKAQIDIERQQLGFIHDLLTEKDDALVNAISKTLTTLGFEKIVDMDKELKESGNKEPKREDLQLRDRNPLLLIEAKGIFGTVQDHQGLQVLKYINTRMKQLGRVDIRGLSIVNHQRAIPPLDRQINPFNEDVLNTVEENDIGLLTTWNLFRLVRNFQRWGWRHEDILSLFYRNGFIEPIPSHYVYLGEIEKYYPGPSAVSIKIENEQINLNDRIAFELPIEFEEQDVASLRLENEPASTVVAGQFAGITTTLGKDQLKPGMRVYLVRRAD